MDRRNNRMDAIIVILVAIFMLLVFSGGMGALFMFAAVGP